ncbi:MAG: AraC family transcriptional regulator [Lentisphaerales bacterium]|nr:AraC family transcriptional regulator [Lentisphaerales bacterium]
MLEKNFVENFKKSMQDQTAVIELFQHLPGIVFFVKDLDYRFTIVNDALVRLVKASSQEDVIGKSGFDYYPRKRADEFHADDQIVYDTGEALINRLEMIFDETGVMSWFSTNKLPLFGKNGEVIGLMATTRNLGRAEGLSHFPVKISRTIDYISENYKSTIIIEELAEMNHLSVSQFRRNFKKHLKMSPLQFILKLRIQATCNLLQTTDDGLWEIAESCGFTDQSYFSKQFRQHIGISPGQYRSQYGY